MGVLCKNSLLIWGLDYRASDFGNSPRAETTSQFVLAGQQVLAVGQFQAQRVQVSKHDVKMSTSIVFGTQYLGIWVLGPSERWVMFWHVAAAIKRV